MFNGNAELVLLGMYYSTANKEFRLDDIDDLIAIAESFCKKHKNTDWEFEPIDWADSLAIWYNEHLKPHWNPIEISEN